SANPVKRKLEEDLVGALIGEAGIEVTVIPHLYDLAADGTGMLCLQGITGDMIVLSWLFRRAAHWTLDRNAIRGQVGETLLARDAEDDDDEDEATEPPEEKDRVVDQREMPSRKIYCLDLRWHDNAEPYLEEIRRIAAEAATQTVDLMSFISGSPKPEQLDRYLNPASGNGNGRPIPAAPSPADTSVVSQDAPSRRWYPVIDFSRCTNCMECIDFCLFGVYGVDHTDVILVEEQDSCKKGCPACSRVCPENAIIFPGHKTPAIAGADGEVGNLKIDLSKLFGAPDKSALDMAVSERDVELVADGRDAVGMAVGIPKRQENKETVPRDELDDLMDGLDDLDL
ncbi:MAG: ferredoxin family protein, partial [Planctomycetes bacterium]|nr:ferredoxin family protein [Planctomycetota bacterium]